MLCLGFVMLKPITSVPYEEHLCKMSDEEMQTVLSVEKDKLMDGLRRYPEYWMPSEMILIDSPDENPAIVATRCFSSNGSIRDVADRSVVPLPRLHEEIAALIENTAESLLDDRGVDHKVVDGLTKAIMKLVAPPPWFKSTSTGRVSSKTPNRSNVPTVGVVTFERKMQIVMDLKKTINRRKDDGKWYWHDNDETCMQGPFASFSAAVNDIVEPYISEGADEHADLSVEPD